MNEPQPHSKAVLDGPLLSKLPGDVTIIWRDGDVIRQSPRGQLQVRPSIPAIPEHQASTEVAR